jgi:hypothetical protein
MKKVQSGEWRLPDEPLTYKPPPRAGMELLNDPWFWPTAVVIFVIFSYVFGGCL